MMKKLTVLLLIAVFAMGVYDGGDVTGAVVLGMMFLPGLMESHTVKKGAGAEVLSKHNGIVFITKDCENREVFADDEKTRKSFDCDGAMHPFLGGIEVREHRQ